MKKPKVEYPKYQAIPKRIDLFGRTITISEESEKLSLRNVYGEARYGTNQIALNRNTREGKVSQDELKLTYLHEMLHFILNFTGYETIIREGSKIDIEQFIELLASGIYQYEKSAVYK